MKAYKLRAPRLNKLYINKSNEGQSIEQKIERIITNKEPIKGEVKLIYTDRKDGVKPSFNPKTDRFEVAIDATTKIERRTK